MNADRADRFMIGASLTKSPSGPAWEESRPRVLPYARELQARGYRVETDRPLADSWSAVCRRGAMSRPRMFYARDTGHLRKCASPTSSGCRSGSFVGEPTRRRILTHYTPG